jgi:hypothetical protein
MSAEHNLRIVQDMYAAFGRADLGFVLEQIDDACDGFGVISGTPTQVPWHLDLKTRGKPAAVRYFEALASSVDHRPSSSATSPRPATTCMRRCGPRR